MTCVFCPCPIGIPLCFSSSTYSFLLSVVAASAAANAASSSSLGPRGLSCCSSAQLTARRNGWVGGVISYSNYVSALEGRKAAFKMRNEHAASAYLASRHRPSLPKHFEIHSSSTESRPCLIRSNSEFVTLRFQDPVSKGGGSIGLDACT
jgi:hypothetical protein